MVMGFLFFCLSSCEKDNPIPEYGVPSAEFVKIHDSHVEFQTENTQIKN